MEAVDIVKSIRWHRKMPWNVEPDTIDPPLTRPDVRPGEEALPAPGRVAYCAAAVLRLFVSGALTAVVAASYPQVTSPLVSFLVGLGALSAVQQIATLTPLLVRTVGQAALGGVTAAAQQDAYGGAHQRRRPPARQPDPLPEPPPEPARPGGAALAPGNPALDTGVAVRQEPTDAGGIE